jgi:hypothetical protein
MSRSFPAREAAGSSGRLGVQGILAAAGLQRALFAAGRRRGRDCDAPAALAAARHFALSRPAESAIMHGGLQR